MSATLSEFLNKDLTLRDLENCPWFKSIDKRFRMAPGTDPDEHGDLRRQLQPVLNWGSITNNIEILMVLSKILKDNDVRYYTDRRYLEEIYNDIVSNKLVEYVKGILNSNKISGHLSRNGANSTLVKQIINSKYVSPPEKQPAILSADFSKSGSQGNPPVIDMSWFEADEPKKIIADYLREHINPGGPSVHRAVQPSQAKANSGQGPPGNLGLGIPVRAIPVPHTYAVNDDIVYEWNPQYLPPWFSQLPSRLRYRMQIMNMPHERRHIAEDMIRRFLRANMRDITTLWQDDINFAYQKMYTDFMNHVQQVDLQIKIQQVIDYLVANKQESDVVAHYQNIPYSIDADIVYFQGLLHNPAQISQLLYQGYHATPDQTFNIRGIKFTKMNDPVDPATRVRQFISHVPDRDCTVCKGKAVTLNDPSGWPRMEKVEFVSPPPRAVAAFWDLQGVSGVRNITPMHAASDSTWKAVLMRPNDNTVPASGSSATKRARLETHLDTHSNVLDYRWDPGDLPAWFSELPSKTRSQRQVKGIAGLPRESKDVAVDMIRHFLSANGMGPNPIQEDIHFAYQRIFNDFRDRVQKIDLQMKIQQVIEYLMSNGAEPEVVDHYQNLPYTIGDDIAFFQGLVQDHASISAFWYEEYHPSLAYQGNAFNIRGIKFSKMYNLINPASRVRSFIRHIPDEDCDVCEGRPGLTIRNPSNWPRMRWIHFLPPPEAQPSDAAPGGGSGLFIGHAADNNGRIIRELARATAGGVADNQANRSRINGLLRRFYNTQRLMERRVVPDLPPEPVSDQEYEDESIVYDDLGVAATGSHNENTNNVVHEAESGRDAELGEILDHWSDDELDVQGNAEHYSDHPDFGILAHSSDEEPSHHEDNMANDNDDLPAFETMQELLGDLDWHLPPSPHSPSD